MCNDAIEESSQCTYASHEFGFKGESFMMGIHLSTGFPKVDFNICKSKFFVHTNFKSALNFLIIIYARAYPYFEQSNLLFNKVTIYRRIIYIPTYCSLKHGSEFALLRQEFVTCDISLIK